MVLSMEDEEELEALQRDVGLVYEAMLSFPLRLPWTRFYNGLQVMIYMMIDITIYNQFKPHYCYSIIFFSKIFFKK